MNFFDPNSTPSPLFAMGGTGHLVLVLVLFGILGALVVNRKNLWKLRANRSLMAGTAGFVLALELFSTALAVVYGPSEPAIQRLPLHLCASLKIAIATLILFERYDLVKYLSIWSIGAGFISFANLNLNGGSFENFAFWHYLVGHYYLFAIPLFLFLTGEFRYDFGYHLRSMLGLFVWSLVIFFINWVFDANYMYSGPSNHTVVAFVPPQYMIWPLNYVCYLVIGLVLLSAIYGILKISQQRMEPAAAPA